MFDVLGVIPSGVVRIGFNSSKTKSSQRAKKTLWKTLNYTEKVTRIIQITREYHAKRINIILRSVIGDNECRLLWAADTGLRRVDCHPTARGGMTIDSPQTLSLIHI